jgi:hypothetical protein
MQVNTLRKAAMTMHSVLRHACRTNKRYLFLHGYFKLIFTYQPKALCAVRSSLAVSASSVTDSMSSASLVRLRLVAAALPLADEMLRTSTRQLSCCAWRGKRSMIVGSEHYCFSLSRLNKQIVDAVCVLLQVKNTMRCAADAITSSSRFSLMQSSSS